MRFSKWHALGNSYLLLERADLQTALEPDEVRRLCDTHRGVGADGVLEVIDVRGPEAEVVVWNPDGSTAELSGNGARIAAMWLARRSGVAFPRLRIGDRTIPARIEADEVEVDLGEIVVEKPEALEVGDERIEVTPVSVGNPHAVIKRENPSREELLRLGPLVEVHERFPGRTNVQLVRPVSATDLAVLVWERGAGETLASGSSAAAAAAAAVTHGWSESPVRVHLPGGTLTVDIRESRAIVRGPVAEIFRGEISTATPG
jgi:diaminopimelate epimerase